MATQSTASWNTSQPPGYRSTRPDRVIAQRALPGGLWVWLTHFDYTNHGCCLKALDKLLAMTQNLFLNVYFAMTCQFSISVSGLLPPLL